MFYDIVKPQGNEEELIAMAVTLGIDGLVFFSKKPSLPKASIPLHTAWSSKSHIIISDINSVTKETKVLLMPSHVLRHSEYKELSKRNIAMLFSFSEFVNASHSATETFSRHIRLCKKHHVKLIAASLADNPFMMRTQKDFSALLIFAGLDTVQIKESFEHAKNLVS